MSIVNPLKHYYVDIIESCIEGSHNWAETSNGEEDRVCVNGSYPLG